LSRIILVAIVEPDRGCRVLPVSLRFGLAP